MLDHVTGVELDGNRLTYSLSLAPDGAAINPQTCIGWIPCVDLTTTYVYHADGDLVQTIDPRGNSTRATYGSFGEPLTNTDALGNTTRNHFDSRGLLRTITAPSGNITRLEYDDQGNMTSARNGDGVTGTTRKAIRH